VSAFARSYARAFLESAPSGLDVDGFLSRAGAVRDALAADHRLKAFLSAPSIPARTKGKVVAELARKVGLDEFGTRFLDVVLTNRRLLQLAEILSTIRAEADRRGGVVHAVVTVASPVDPAERERIAERLSTAVGKKVRVTLEVDPAILAGFVARIGSEVFDASARGAVDTFSERAKESAEA
jgi:F-type H+-transporting ATPase subunit delta